LKNFIFTASGPETPAYDGRKIMGSEGYFQSIYCCAAPIIVMTSGAANYQNRIKLPIEVVRRVAEAVGKSFIIIFVCRCLIS